MVWLHAGAARGLDEDGVPDESLRAELVATMERLAAEGGGSSQRVERLLVLREPAGLDAGEITDKGYVNQRAVRERRSDDVVLLVGGAPGGARRRPGESGPCLTVTSWSTRTCTSRSSTASPRPGSTGPASSAAPGILEEIWDADGAPDPAALDRLIGDEGVDVALLFCEYSPKATGYQLFDDLLPLVEQNPRRFRPVANVNPHLHFPIARELGRQLDHGAAALKIHPVHGGFRADDAALYPAYSVLVERGVPLVVHCGTSSFPGSTNAYADPHAASTPSCGTSRTWTSCSPTAAAAGGTTRRPSWPCPGPTSGSSCRGCRPSGCPSTTRRFDLGRLARKWIFGTDWPGVPGQAANARAVAVPRAARRRRPARARRQRAAGLRRTRPA